MEKTGLSNYVYDNAGQTLTEQEICEKFERDVP